MVSGSVVNKSFSQMITEIPKGKRIAVHPYDLEQILLELEPLEKLKGKVVLAVVAGVKYKWQNFYSDKEAF